MRELLFLILTAVTTQGAPYQEYEPVENQYEGNGEQGTSFARDPMSKYRLARDYRNTWNQAAPSWTYDPQVNEARENSWQSRQQNEQQNIETRTSNGNIEAADVAENQPLPSNSYSSQVQQPRPVTSYAPLWSQLWNSLFGTFLQPSGSQMYQQSQSRQHTLRSGNGSTSSPFYIMGNTMDVSRYNPFNMFDWRSMMYPQRSGQLPWMNPMLMYNNMFQ